MNTVTRLMIGFGLFLFAGYLVLYVVLKQFNGEVFELPNHMVVIQDNSFHIYSKKISYEFKYEAPEETK